MLKPGRNELALRIPSGKDENQEGKLFGPVFLTITEPKEYPYLGKGANARYADVKNWQMYSNERYHEPVLDEARRWTPSARSSCPARPREKRISSPSWPSATAPPYNIPAAKRGTIPGGRAWDTWRASTAPANRPPRRAA